MLQKDVFLRPNSWSFDFTRRNIFYLTFLILSELLYLYVNEWLSTLWFWSKMTSFFRILSSKVIFLLFRVKNVVSFIRVLSNWFSGFCYGFYNIYNSLEIYFSTSRLNVTKLTWSYPYRPQTSVGKYRLFSIYCRNYNRSTFFSVIVILLLSWKPSFNDMSNLKYYNTLLSLVIKISLGVVINVFWKKKFQVSFMFTLYLCVHSPDYSHSL